MFIFLQLDVPILLPFTPSLKFQYVYISTHQNSTVPTTQNDLKFQYVYISTSVFPTETNKMNLLKFQYVYISTQTYTEIFFKLLP